MKILVYGAGAVGGYLAGRLSQQGHDTAVIVRDITASIIKENGLAITENGLINRTHPTVYTSIAEAFKLTKDGAAYDLIIMSMKAYDIATAIDPLVAFCTQPPPIIAVQNGIGIEAPLIKQYGTERTIASSFTIPISRESTNSLIIEHGDRGMALAPTQKGQDISQWVALFQNAGITTVSLPDYEAMKWSKALLNMAGNATSAILNRSPDAIYKIAPLFDLEIRMLKETLDVMKKLKLKAIDLPGAPATQLVFGVKYSPKLLLKPILTQIVSKGRGEKMPSFHIDLSSNKGKSEVVYHNGAVAQAGQKVGVPTPVNLTLTTVLLKLVRQELDWRDYDGNAKRLLQDVRRTEREVNSKQ